jgi:hypothetical protein
VPPLRQTGPPEPQSTVPLVQIAAGVHAAPCEHATQVPAPLQTPPEHDVPAPAGEPAVQIGVPVEHEIVPVRHALLGVQLDPGEHPLHRPAPSHTPPGHAAPAETLLAN